MYALGVLGAHAEHRANVCCGVTVGNTVGVHVQVHQNCTSQKSVVTSPSAGHLTHSFQNSR